MDLKFYSELPDGCSSNVDAEFMETQEYGGYSGENKFSESSDSYLAISGAGHHFLSAEQTFHTPSLGDEVFEIPPISLDPDQALSISDSHFDLTDGSDDNSGSSGPRSLVSNLVVEANDPSFASTFVNTGSQSLEQLNLGAIGQAGGGGLISSSALEMGTSSGSHFSRSPPMTIDVQLSELGHGLLNPSELTLGLSGNTSGHHSDANDEPLLISSSPLGSPVDEDMDDFKRSLLVDSPVSLSSSPTLSHMFSNPAPPCSATPAAPRRGSGKPAAVASAAEATGGKKGRKRKDPNEPQKPVSAYALFFRDTQSAIKGQNPSASFGEVSKIVASMWDSLAEDQKQVYKKKTEASKKEYLKALAAYKASQLSQPVSLELETSSPVVNLIPSAPAGQQTILLPSAIGSAEANTNICASNIILDVPEVMTPSHLENQANAPGAILAPAQTITKIIIPKHLLQGGGQVVTLLSGGVGAAQPTLLVSSASRQPPPLQQMQNAPPPPRLQQMAPAPPPLQAKPREGATAFGQPAILTATPPPPLQIKIVPAPVQVQDRLAPAVVVPSIAAAATSGGSSATASGDDDVTEVLDSDEDVMEVSASTGDASVKSICVRAGCTNPAVDSKDWDKEYCSNECVATHCRDVFKAWCSIRNQNLGTVK
ncbi:TOX high mobility group box family member 4-B [Cyprinodon tularosa]|uniref:TOX high mobility group box family member 4-B n=1 Tax=Cyprinodon tularosa TaxID=77115 RepID=UPI0018E2421E|nr:TOX high mobility group box family member 4-B [Cyprinodon tularosa]